MPDSGRHTVQSLIDDWLEATTLRPRTKSDYKALASRYILPVLGHAKLSRLEPAHLQRLYADLQTKGLVRAPSQVHRLIHRALRIAVLWGWLPHNPADRVLAPTYAAPRQEVWAVEDVRRFLEGTNSDRLNPLWTILAATGMRIGEVLGLRWEDVDFTIATVSVRQSLYRLGGEWTTAEPKTRAGRRIIELPQSAMTAFRKQRLQQTEWNYRLASSGTTRDWFSLRPADGLWDARSSGNPC